MAYSEYINGTCTHYNDYHDTVTCSNYTPNYYNGAYRNHSNGSSATYHQNYGNSYLNTCSKGYDCTDYHDHHDHTDYSMSDKGVAMSLTWTSPWSGTSQNRSLDVNYITGATPAIKELRDNISSITNKLHYAANIPSPIINVPDSVFDDGNPNTAEYVLPPQNNDLKSNLDNLWSAIKGDDDSTTPGVPSKNTSDSINKIDWEKLANKADELAGYADPSYLNHVNYANGQSGGYAGPPD